MTKILKLLLVILLISCHRYSENKKAEINNDKPQVTQESDAAITVQEEDWLIIGGQRVKESYVPSLGEYKYYRNIDIENIERILLYIDPQNTNRATSFEGIERLVNLERLYIHGRNWDTIEYSPLRDLRHLKTIQFVSEEIDKLTRVPDLSGLASKNLITEISFSGCALTSMDNLEHLPNLRFVTVASNSGNLLSLKALSQARQMQELKIFSYEESVYRLEEISSLTDLKLLYLSGKSVDAKGIENFTSLEVLDFFESEVRNAQYLSGLKALEMLKISLKDDRPDISFLIGMDSLTRLIIHGADGTWCPKKKESYQILDLTPIGKLPRLEVLEIRGFRLKNVSALDNLDNIEEANVYQSVLYDSSEKTMRVWLRFEWDQR